MCSTNCRIDFQLALEKRYKPLALVINAGEEEKSVLDALSQSTEAKICGKKQHVLSHSEWHTLSAAEKENAGK